MMTSKAGVTAAFVWIWLPGAADPVVAGRLDPDGERLLFTYGASYHRRRNAISIFEPELPLHEGTIPPFNGLPMASCIRDGSPDAWGCRVIINRLTSKTPDAAGAPEISELTSCWSNTRSQLLPHSDNRSATRQMSSIDRKLFAGRQFLNSYALKGLAAHKVLRDAFSAARETLITSDRA